MAKSRTKLMLASALLIMLAPAAPASASRSSFFGKTADKVKLTFNVSHTSVSLLKTTLTVDVDPPGRLAQLERYGFQVLVRNERGFTRPI